MTLSVALRLIWEAFASPRTTSIIRRDRVTGKITVERVPPAPHQ